ncbi:MAG: SUMF1/EgtB/PvdO family nonheme iron enzyme [Pirellulales bacterium]
MKWKWPADFPAPALAPFDAEQARHHQNAWAQKLQVAPFQDTPQGLKLALIPPGEFERGSAGDVFGIASVNGVGAQWADYSRPVRRIRLTRPMRMSTTEVTVGQFRRFVEATKYQTEAERDPKRGWWFNERGEHAQGPDWTWNAAARQVQDDEPVVFVTRRDADAYCAWLSKEEQVHYRLPTETEWEFACRAGAMAKFGVAETHDGLAPWAWANEFLSTPVEQRRHLVHPVGQKQANAFGLYDLLGNVWEICTDGLAPAVYASASEVNPITPAAASWVIRGGSFVESWTTSNPAVRSQESRPFGHIGFRVVQELAVPPELEPLPSPRLPTAGEPLGKRALVAAPTPIPGLKSWSIETLGFRAGIAAVDYSPAARLVAASSSIDPVIRLYDDKLRFQKAFVGPAANVSSLEFSPDGAHLAAVSWGSDWDNGVRVWETATGRLVYHDDSGQWCAWVGWSPDGRQLAYAQSGESRIVDLRSGISRAIVQSHGHMGAWSHDGTRIAFRDNTWKIRIYDAASLTLLQELAAPAGNYNGPMGWSSAGKYFAALSDSGDLNLLDGKTFAPAKSFKPTTTTTKLLWTPDEQQLVLIGGKAVLWDVEKNQSAGEVAVAGPADWIEPGKSLVFGRADGLLEIRSVAGVPEARAVDRGRPAAHVAVLSPAGDEIAVQIGGDLTFWDAESGERKASFTGAVAKDAQLEWAPDGKRIAAWAAKEFFIIDRASGSKSAAFAGHGEVIHSVAWRPDGSRLATTSADKTVRIWDAANGAEVAKQSLIEIPYDASWSPDAGRLAVHLTQELVLLAGDGSNIESRHAINGTYSWRPGAHGVAWTPDNRYVTTGAYANALVLIDTLRGRREQFGSWNVVAPLVGVHDWSPDGRRILSTTTYQDAALFDRDSLQLQTFFPCTRGQWHADGRRIVATYERGELYGYDSDRRRRTGVLIPGFTGVAGQAACISAAGHYRGPAGAVVYVALTDAGEQVTYTPAQFEQAFGWKNDPTQASLLKLNDTAAPPSSSFASAGDEGQAPATAASAPATIALPKVAASDDAIGPFALAGGAAPFASGERWTVETRGHRGGVHSIAWSPLGAIIATAGDDAAVRLWGEDGRPQGVLLGARGPIKSLAWSRDGKYLAAAGDDRGVCWWDASSRTLLRRVELPSTPASVTWAPDASKLALAVYGGVWTIDAASGETREVATQVDGGVYWPAWAPDGKRFVISYGAELAFFDAATLRPLATFGATPDGSGILALEWSPAGDVIVGVYGPNGVHVGFWDAHTGAFLGKGDIEMAPHGTRIRFARDGMRVLTGGNGFHLFDVATRRAIASTPRGGWADLAPDGRRVAAVQANHVYVFDPFSGRELAVTPAAGVTGGGARFALSGDRQKLFSIEGDELSTWDPVRGEILDRRTIEGWQAIFPSPRGDLLAVKSEQRLAVLPLADNKLREFPGHASYIDLVAWSADQQRIASCARDGSIKIWSVATGQVEKSLAIDRRHFDRSFEWRDNETKLVATAHDGAEIEVDIGSGAVVKRLATPSPPSFARSLGASADAKSSWTWTSGGVLRGELSQYQGWRGALVLGLPFHQHALIDHTGHVRGSALAMANLSYVVVDGEGRQTTLTPGEFAVRYPWKNDETAPSLLPAPSPEERPAPPIAADPLEQDRRVAEFALSKGGWVRVRLRDDSRALAVQKATDMPSQPFEVRWIELSVPGITDSDLEQLRGLRSLYSLAIASPEITSEALVRMGPHPHLRRLHLSHSKCDDRLDLSPFPELEELGLSNLPLSDAFAPQLAKLTNLRSLDLSGTKFTDASAPSLAALTGLQYFNAPPASGDETLRQLESAPLRGLNIASTQFTEKSATSLAKWTGLQSVHLDGPGLADAHVETLAKCERLSQATLKSGNFTDQSARQLARLSSVRQLAIHGTKITDATLRELAKLPLVSLELAHNEGVRGDGFDAFVDSPLSSLNLYGDKYAQEQLAAVQKCRNLRSLVLGIGAPTQKLLDALAATPKLASVPFQPWPGGEISLANWVSLESAYLYGAQHLTPADYAAFSTAPKLTRLQVYQGEWKADHFGQLARIPQLKTLLMQNITTTQAELDAFKAQRRDVVVELQGCTIK